MSDEDILKFFISIQNWFNEFPHILEVVFPTPTHSRAMLRLQMILSICLFNLNEKTAELSKTVYQRHLPASEVSGENVKKMHVAPFKECRLQDLFKAGRRIDWLKRLNKNSKQKVTCSKDEWHDLK